MLAALIVAGVCAWMPDFSADGAVCTPANQAVECRCSECIQWAPVPGAVSYAITRTDPDGTKKYGIIKSQIGIDGETIPPVPVWCPIKHDATMPGTSSTTPYEGRLYNYVVQWCEPSKCNAVSNSVSYVGAPFATARPFTTKAN